MRIIKNKSIRVLLLSTILTSLVGCASTTNSNYADPRDPMESFNRSMYHFNSGLDNAAIKPIAEGYQTIMPEPVSTGVTNFFGNLSDVGSAINSLLQFKLGHALSDTGRVLINSTLGVLGLFDVATRMDIHRYKEDFGQTLGTWGIGSGSYLVLPLIGSSSSRDAVGTFVDWYTDPVTYVQPDKWSYRLKILRIIDGRANLLGASKILDQAALDPYEFVRDAYFQKRLSDVYDGSPPEEDIDLDNP